MSLSLSLSPSLPPPPFSLSFVTSVTSPRTSGRHRRHSSVVVPGQLSLSLSLFLSHSLSPLSLSLPLLSLSPPYLPPSPFSLPPLYSPSPPSLSPLPSLRGLAGDAADTEAPSLLSYQAQSLSLSLSLSLPHSLSLPPPSITSAISPRTSR